VKLLLDTVAALYLWAGDTRLSRNVARAIADLSNELVFHQVSYLEITLKYSLGKLPLAEPPATLVPKALKAYQMRYSPLSNADIRGLEELPFHHRDPFDRLLIVHSCQHQLVLATPDRSLRSYGVPMIW